MGSKREVGSRYLIKELCDFWERKSDNRNCLVKLIKAHTAKGKNSISLCFRGDYVTLYYRCGQLLRLEYRTRTKSIVGIFDFNYAYTNKDIAAVREQLEKLGVIISKSVEHPICRIVLDGENCITSDNLEKVLKKYINLIDEWKAVNPSMEKDRQQELYSIHFNDKNQTYYDIEYTEPRETLIDAGYYDFAGKTLEEKKAAHKKHNAGKFDLLGLRRTDGGYILQLVELKSTIDACTRKTSGVESHRIDYTTYRQFPKLIEKRKQDAVNTIALLSKIFENDYSAGGITLNDIVDIEIVFIFTDDSVKVIDNYRDSLEKDGIKIICYNEDMHVIE